MSDKPKNTTIKVTGRVLKFIENNSENGESIDATLRRLLRIKKTTKAPSAPKELPAMTTIKVSKVVMSRIIKGAKPEESRDQTLARLLKIKDSEDANVQQEVPK